MGNGWLAYVTGGGQGIGRAFAHALGEAGAKVAVVDLVLAKAKAVAYELSLKAGCQHCLSSHSYHIICELFINVNSTREANPKFLTKNAQRKHSSET
uniref:Uncharacterized protein n=1 Tax=Amazona collaria TaxID=241587 RepID=A0A8B9GLJ6_9PSIT